MNTLYRLTIAIENLINEDRGTKSILDAYRSLVKKWLIWYIPILPFPVGDWWTKDKNGAIHLLPIATMPLAYAQYWFDVDSGPVPIGVTNIGYSQEGEEKKKSKIVRPVFSVFTTGAFIIDSGELGTVASPLVSGRIELYLGIPKIYLYTSLLYTHQLIDL
ncbi:MAG: hypothetical protein ACRCTQ_02910 [Brevinemataceae bacterium]